MAAATCEIPNSLWEELREQGLIDRRYPHLEAAKGSSTDDSEEESRSESPCIAGRAMMGETWVDAIDRPV